MNKKNRFIRALPLALVAALMAGCSAFVAVRALGFAVGAAWIYLAAIAVALVMNLLGGRALWSAAAFGGTMIAAGALFAVHHKEIAETIAALAEAGEAAFDAYASAGNALGIIFALILGALFGVLVRSEAGKPFAILIFLAATICSLALNEALSVWLALPGLMAAVAAFGMPTGRKAEGPRLAIAVPAVVLAVLALCLVPAERTTWAPLENLAMRIRAIVEDYIHFTQQRIVFSINEQGYDRAGMIDDEVVAMLGGPANPKEEAVMQVETDQDILLRGTIKRTYTGYSWVDDQVKARYLYYDFTHRGVRSEVFDQNRLNGDAFETVAAEIEMLGEGTSTLFVPAHMDAFSMDLENAVYYNSIGEIFLTRDVAEGDRYQVSASVAASDEALLRAAAEAENVVDDRFAEMRDIYTALPQGIDSRVYALAVEITEGKTSAAQKAFAIEEYLAQNYQYTLDGGIPAAGQDFVSFFLLEAKEGYCSYFASAMTVLCRIAGVPARYVEGYAVKAEEGGVTVVTGEDAHAWVEVYLNGLGWTAFDPTARASEQSGEGDSNGANISDEGEDSDQKQDTPFGDDRVLDDPIEPSVEPTPTPTLPPEHPDDGGQDATPTPSPTPDGDGQAQDQPTPTPEPQLPDASRSDADPPQDPSGGDDSDDSRKNRAWLWMLIGILLLLLLIAGAALWVKKRLEKTDPLRLCARARSAQAASLILYRSILTLLAQMGQTPASGETPQAFAARVTQAIPNAEYADFVSEVVRSRYSGKPVDRNCVEMGRKAYLSFLSGMRRGEKIRFMRQRLTHGLGSFELIP